jgi:transposase-like protein
VLINRNELARKVLEGEITSLDDLNSVLRSMIKDVVETAMGAEMTGFLAVSRGYWAALV